MAATQFMLPYRPAFDSNAKIIPGALLWFTLSGTDTPTPAYTSAALTTPLTNPVVANGAGRFPPIWYDTSIDYRVRLYEPDAEVGTDDPIEEYDPYSGGLEDTALRVDLAASTGAALVSAVASGAGAQSRTVQSKLRESVSVTDFTGADTTGVADSLAAFNAAITALPASGGTIHIPSGSYNLSAEPSIGTKSIVWNIAPDVVFTGAGSGEGDFGYMATNPAQLAVGPYIRSQSAQKSTNVNGGVGAFNVEMLQPDSYGAGQSVAIYAGAKSNNANASGNTWAANFLIDIDSAALGTHQGLEIDVDTDSTSATTKGLAITGGGSANPDSGIHIDRLAGVWAEGIKIEDAQDAFVIAPVSGGRGIVLHAEAGNTVIADASTALSARQYVNNNDTVLLQRFTDTAPTGHFLRAVNAANSSNLVLLDVSGSLTLAGSLAVGTTLSVGGKSVTEGAADSGGAGFKVLRVPN